jgi:hypothetical protein
MFPWLWIWAPHLNYPWSGPVAQRIEPNTNWFFDAIGEDAGDRVIERKAFEVASYGRQLGLLTEILIEIADRQAPLDRDAADSLARLKRIQGQIKGIKEQEAGNLTTEIEDLILRLRKRASDDEFMQLKMRLLSLLGEANA